HPAVALAHVGEGLGVAFVADARLRGRALHDRTRQRGARAEPQGRRAQGALALGGVTQKLQDLHRREDQPERAWGVGVQDVRADRTRVDARLAGAPVERVDEPAVEIHAHDRVPGAGQVERGSPGTTAERQERAARVLRELPPEPQIGVIATALEVVPEGLDVLYGAHAQYSLARPRSASSVRS